MDGNINDPQNHSGIKQKGPTEENPQPLEGRMRNTGFKGCTFALVEVGTGYVLTEALYADRSIWAGTVL